MRLVAVTTVLDEADIIEAFIRHTASYVEHHILLDNGSKDGTLDIIRKLRVEGISISLLHNHSRSYMEPEQRTMLYLKAATQAKADWVLLLDADEFIDDRNAEGGLRGALERVKPAISCVRVICVNYQPTNADDMNELAMPRRMIHRVERGTVPKVIVRSNLWDRDTAITGGSHGVTIDGGQTCPWHDELSVVLAHYPERSAYQTITKFMRGWSRPLAGGEAMLKKGYSNHYRSRFELLRDNPAHLLAGPWLRQFHRPVGDFVRDPLAYKGGDLRYTAAGDEQMRMIRSLVGWLESVAKQHGRLLDECPGAREMVDAWGLEMAGNIEAKIPEETAGD